MANICDPIYSFADQPVACSFKCINLILFGVAVPAIY